MEILSNSIKGFYRDILRGRNNGIIYDSGWLPNTILDTCRTLLAGFMKNDDSSAGIQYLAVGHGLEEWDTGGPPDPEPSVTKLENPCPNTIKYQALALAYLDIDNDEPVEVNGPTKRLQITATLVQGYPSPIPPSNTYPLREFGLFGSYGKTEYMINCVRHPVIHKDKYSTLIRVIRLFF